MPLPKSAMCHSFLFSQYLLLLSHYIVSSSFWPHGLQHARLPCPPLTPRACSNSCPSSQWCLPTITSSVVPFSSCPQSSPAAGSFPVSQFFPSHAKVLELQHQSFKRIFRAGFLWDWVWFHLLAVQGTLKGLLQPFNLNHQFFDAQPSLRSNSYIHIWLLENHSFNYIDLCRPSDVSAS